MSKKQTRSPRGHGRKLWAIRLTEEQIAKVSGRPDAVRDAIDAMPTTQESIAHAHGSEYVEQRDGIEQQEGPGAA